MKYPHSPKELVSAPVDCDTPFQFNVTLLPSLVNLKFETFSARIKILDISVGSVPLLNNSVIFISAGVYSLGNFIGSVFFSIVTDTTLDGFVKLPLFLSYIPAASARYNALR